MMNKTLLFLVVH